MPITKSAKKALRQSQRRRIFNMRRSRKMKQAMKNVRKLAEGGNKEAAEQQMLEAYKAIDKAAKRGVIKDNTAARKKSRLVKAVQKVGS